MSFLPILKVCVTVVFFCAVSTKAHTKTNTEALSLLAVLFASHSTVSALSLVSPSHTYGTQSQHLQPGFPPIWRVCSLGFPGHKHQGETPLSTLALPGLGRQWNQAVESHPRGWASAPRGHLPLVLQHPCPPSPTQAGRCGSTGQTFVLGMPSFTEQFPDPCHFGV